MPLWPLKKKDKYATGIGISCICLHSHRMKWKLLSVLESNRSFYAFNSVIDDDHNDFEFFVFPVVKEISKHFQSDKINIICSAKLFNRFFFLKLSEAI